MKLTRILILPVIALTAGLAASSVSAAPAGGALGTIKALPEASSTVEKTHWVRRCHWTRWGGYRCHRAWVNPRRHWRRW